MKLTKYLEFDAAHRLLNYDGKCSNLHGHTWKVRIIINIKFYNDVIVFFRNKTDGLLMDFGVIKKLIVDKFDHTNLNDILTINPTAENIASVIVLLINLNFNNVNVDKRTRLDYDIIVKLWESSTSSIGVNLYDAMKWLNIISPDVNTIQKLFKEKI